MKEHLARYKREHLGVTEDGLWRGNQKPYVHILPEAVLDLNILETTRDEFWAYFKDHAATIALHTDFHHLNSSQAFAFNLFFPWLNTASAQGRLLSALGVEGEEIVSWNFEHIPDQAERTNFDLFAVLASGRRVLVEVKLTESHFGNVVPKPEHHKKFATVYQPRLAGKMKHETLEESVFFLNYQLFRNVSHLDVVRGDLLLLVLPRGNEFTWQQGEAFLEQLAPSVRDCVRLVSVEELVETLTEQATNVSPRMSEHMGLLRMKYSLNAKI